MRVVALLAVRDEERFVGACIEHLARQGVESYVLDDGSRDATVEIAEGYRGAELAGLERLRHPGVYAWEPLLRRKEELAATLRADWFLHVDADEIRLSPSPSLTLAEALADADAGGCNAVNFQEFTFVPTCEEPDHDHPRFRETMRHYYPFLPRFPDRLNAWKRQAGAVDLASSGGHRVAFPGLRMHPQSFPMRHYLYLSVEHARRKYVDRRYDPAELDRGWHRARAALDADAIPLLPQARLRESTADHDLDASDPWTAHPLFAAGAG